MSRLLEPRSFSGVKEKQPETISKQIETMRVLSRQIRDSIEPGSSRENSKRRLWAGRIENICFNIYGSIKEIETILEDRSKA